MQARARSKFVRISPYKLRPLVDVIRGNSVGQARAWLQTCAIRRSRPVMKTLMSAYANMQQKDSTVSMGDVFVKEIRIDNGPIFRYYKPGAMGRASLQRRRLSHIDVVVGKKMANKIKKESIKER